MTETVANPGRQSVERGAGLAEVVTDLEDREPVNMAKASTEAIADLKVTQLVIGSNWCLKFLLCARQMRKRTPEGIENQTQIVLSTPVTASMLLITNTVRYV
jgi:hypothetical protein